MFQPALLGLLRKPFASIGSAFEQVNCNGLHEGSGCREKSEG
jgi:hypothetical protein